MKQFFKRIKKKLDLDFVTYVLFTLGLAFLLAGLENGFKGVAIGLKFKFSFSLFLAWYYFKIHYNGNK